MQESRFPDSLVLILAMILVAKLATLVLPPGEFERDERKVIPGTYRLIEAEDGNAAEGSGEKAERSFLDTTLGKATWVVPGALLAIPKGLEEGADIIFFVFLIGGVIGVIRRTGSIDAFLASAIRLFGEGKGWLVAGMTAIFALGSSFVGMAEEYMPFIPILVTMCIAMRLDSVVAMGMVYIGAAVGYGCAAYNPFTVLIGQEIAGLEPTSGQWFRWILLVFCLGVGIHHILRYAKKIEADPSKSLVADVDYSEGFDMPEDTRMTPTRVLTLVAFAAMILVFVVGVDLWEWYLVELTALFLGVGILAAALAKMSPNETAKQFCSGAAEMTTTALLIGFARTIQVVLDDAQVTDTVIHGIATQLERFGSSGSAIGMLGVQSVCNFLVPSGSGQAYVTMPIMAPLGDLTGVSRQTAVLAYQMGDGFMNIIVPTNALLMGMLGLGKIPYQRWFKFVLPFLVKIYLVAIAALLVAVAIEY